MRLKFGLGDYVEIGASYTPFPLSIGVVLKPHSSRSLVFVNGTKQEYPNEALRYVPQREIEEKQFDKDAEEFFNKAEQDFAWEHVEAEIAEEEWDDNLENNASSKFALVKEYAKEILAFVAIAVIATSVVLLNTWEGKSLNASIDEEINSNNGKISSYLEVIQEANTEIDKLKIRNSKLFKTKVEVSTN